MALSRVLAATLLLAIPAWAQEPGEADMKMLAQKANNPLSDVWLLILQNDTTLYKGDLLKGTKTVNSTKLQPVMPVPILGGDWNLIFRPVIQLQSLPFDSNLDRLIGAGPTQIEADP